MKKILASVTAIVVTYNRKELLIKCLSALNQQTLMPEKILVVNNASTDGTIEALNTEGWFNKPNIEILSLPENSGGAGGFSAGMRYAFDNGADYVWVMDDDACPYPTALEELIKYVSPEHIYASLAVKGEEISWEMTIKQCGNWFATHDPKDIPEKVEVQSLPFLGFLVHRNLVEKIGLPAENFFIAADDTEYCLRAREAGSELYLVGRSRIEHPKSFHHPYNFFGQKINYVSLPAWKRYYDTRNRIFIAKKYFGTKLYSQTIPSLVFRFLITLLYDKDKLKQSKAYFWGVCDGFMSRGGKRHENKGLY